MTARQETVAFVCGVVGVVAGAWWLGAALVPEPVPCLTSHLEPERDR